MKYSIVVRNGQGASEGTIGTQEEIDAYLASWNDPESLIAEIKDENFEITIIKPIGERTINWS